MRNTRVIAPVIYGAVVAIVAVTGGPVAIVAIIGAILLGLFFALGAAGRTPREGRARARR